jgi:hypothetical protein
MIIKIPFTVPTKRIDGTDLSLSEIDRIEFFVSTDSGVEYTSIGHAAADGSQTDFLYEATEFGSYLFKAQTVDTQNPARVSLDSSVVSFSIAPPTLAAPEAPVLGTPVAG